jgi:hypothetical protein
MALLEEPLFAVEPSEFEEIWEHELPLQKPDASMRHQTAASTVELKLQMVR